MPPKVRKWRKKQGQGTSLKLGSFNDAKVMNRPELIPFRARITQAFPDSSTTIASFDIVPSNLGDRITRISDEFLEYRIEHMTITCMSDYGTSAVAAASTQNGFYDVSLSGPIGVAAVAAVDDMVDAPVFNQGTMAQPSKTVTEVPKSFWGARNFNWFFTRDVGTDDLSVCARLTLATTMSFTPDPNPTLHVFLDGVIAFRTPIDGDINPQNNFRSDRLSKYLAVRKLLPPQISWQKRQQLEQKNLAQDADEKETLAVSPALVGVEDIPSDLSEERPQGLSATKVPPKKGSSWFG